MRIPVGAWILASSVLAITLQAWAQAPTDQAQPTAAAPDKIAPPPSATAAPSRPGVPDKLSKEAIRKGAAVGFQARLSKEGVLYCRDDATIGTRIKSTHCFTDMEFDNYLIQLKAARDDMQRQGCTGGDNCNASKGQK